MAFLHALVTLLFSLCAAADPFNPRNQYNAQKLTSAVAISEAAAADATDGYTTYTIEFPVDHFQNDSQYAPHSDGTFSNRYWFDATYYKPGGPVFLLNVGEASGTLRLPILKTGIVQQFMQENNGLGVVLEHRYYGESFPVPNLETPNLRFLTTQQAMADCAYFAQNVKFAGLENHDLTSPTTPWIAYGGSYSGAYTAFLRVQYPEVFWGTIGSSGVVEDDLRKYNQEQGEETLTRQQAIYDYWPYYAAVKEYGPQSCMAAQTLFTHVIDTIYDKNDKSLNAQLQSTFGLPNVTYFDDFADAVTTSGVGNWQEIIWDPAISSPAFAEFCGNLTSSKVLYVNTESKRSAAEHLLSEGGYTPNKTITNQMLNYIGWTNENVVQYCAGLGLTQEECLGTHNATNYQGLTALADYGSVSWPYQTCKQWGFYQTGDWPKNELPLISRTITLKYMTIYCRDQFGIHTPPDVQLSLQYGGYNISYDRLALIDGQWDPWRSATVHGFGYGAQPRKSTTQEPFILIPKAIHHWDEYGVPASQVTKNFPPKSIQSTQAQEHKFVKAWLAEFNAPPGGYNSTSS